MNRIAIDIANAITPPNLLGIDRRIAYANRKYHSGWMWIGVTSGFAGIKLSGSPRRYGSFSDRVDRIINRTMNPTISLVVKYGWNGILSMSLFSPIGLFDPVWWRNSRWIITIPVITNGIRKCKAKNRVSVALSTAKPPHIHCTNSVPTYGTADSRFVITVAPQNDICPHGRTYPRNAVAIVVNIISTPIDHVCTSLYDP
jgi:hypothetical protein